MKYTICSASLLLISHFKESGIELLVALNVFLLLGVSWLVKLQGTFLAIAVFLILFNLCSGEH